MGTIEAVELPTEAEYDRALKALGKAHSEIERLAWRLRRLEPHHEDGVLVSVEPSRRATLADVGLLWSFLDGVKLGLSATHDRVTDLDEALRALDICRIEGYVVTDAEAG